MMERGTETNAPCPRLRFLPLAFITDDSNTMSPSIPTSPASPQLFPPNSTSPSLSPLSIPYASLLGSWHVYVPSRSPTPQSLTPLFHRVASTLPLWKNKKNVRITYTPIPSAPATTFDDLVEYNSIKDAVGVKPSTVRGVDRIEEGENGGCWKWLVSSLFLWTETEELGS
jgi:hypothetical protein